MNGMHLLTAACVVLSSLLTGCKKQPAPAESPNVIVLHTGRLRGNVYPPGAAATVPLQHYARLAGYIKSVRAEAQNLGAQVILVDLGDSLSGSFASYVTNSRNMIEFFNAAGYDAICLGNLDAGIDPAHLEELNALLLTPFQSEDGGFIPIKARPMAEIEGANALCRLYANFYGDTPPETAPHRFPSWFMNSERGVSPVRNYAALQSSTDPQDSATSPPVLNLFCWMKFEAPQDPPKAFLDSLRELGVDAILAHRIYSGSTKDVWVSDSLLPWNPPVSQNILRENRGFTVSRLDLKRDGDNWRVIGHRLVPMNDPGIVPDQRLDAVLAPLAKEIKEADAVLAELPSQLERQDILHMVIHAFGNVENATAAAYSMESVRSELPSGSLRASQLFEALPWTGSLMRLTIPIARLGELSELEAVRVFIKPGTATEPTESVSLITSRYFATLIADKLNLSNADSEIVAKSEANFLQNQLLENGTQLLAPKPGWQPLKP